MSFKAALAITDPSDFHHTKIPKFFELDSLVRCHICKEFLTAPMLTSCGHSFCSMCIRKYLIHTPKCPICSKELRESHLSRNVLMEQVVLSYKDLRPDLLKVLTMEKEKKEEKGVRNGGHDPPQKDTEIIDVDEFVSDSLDDEDDIQIIEEHTKKRKSPNSHGIDALFKRKKEEPKKADVEMGECPVCQRFYPLEDLQTTHIDLCLAGEIPPDVEQPPQRSSSLDPPSRSSSVTPGPQPSSSASKLSYFQPKEPAITYTRLTKMDFPSVSTSMLKSKLAKLDLPITGTRTQLETRYNEYLILWNANCDSVSPRDARVLRKQLAQWESSLAFNVKSKKQLDKEGWKELIEQARSGLKNKNSDEPDKESGKEEEREKVVDKEVQEQEHSDQQESIIIKSQSQERFFED